MLHARHFKLPRTSHQEPCEGTGLVVVDVVPNPPSSTEHQHAICPKCDQSIVLTTIVPSKRRGGVWESP